MGKPHCKFTLTEVTNRLISFILLFHKFKTCNYLILEEHIILYNILSISYLHCGRSYILLGTYNRIDTRVLAQIILPWMTTIRNMIIALCFDTYDGLKFNITRPCQYKLESKEAMSMILHCTLMNIMVDSFPQVLFTMHLYSPLWFLLMLMIVSSFPSVTWPVLTFFQKTFKGGVPAATLHPFNTFLPSSTVTFCICSKAAGTGRDGREKGGFLVMRNKAWVKIHLGKYDSHEKTMDQQFWKTSGLKFHGKWDLSNKTCFKVSMTLSPDKSRL